MGGVGQGARRLRLHGLQDRLPHNRVEFDSVEVFEFGVEGLGWKSFMEFLDVYLAGYIKDKDELTDAIKKSMV